MFLPPEYKCNCNDITQTDPFSGVCLKTCHHYQLCFTSKSDSHFLNHLILMTKLFFFLLYHEVLTLQTFLLCKFANNELCFILLSVHFFMLKTYSYNYHPFTILSFLRILLPSHLTHIFLFSSILYLK